MDGFSSKQVCGFVALTDRQLDAWCRAGLVTPSVNEGLGLGSRRRWSKDDVVRVAVVKQVVGLGYSYAMCQSLVSVLHKVKVVKSGVLLTDGEKAKLVEFGEGGKMELAAHFAGMKSPIVCVSVRSILAQLKEVLA
jgi:DNA-binding transcriptional MerR regulator